MRPGRAGHLQCSSMISVLLFVLLIFYCHKCFIKLSVLKENFSHFLFQESLVLLPHFFTKSLHQNGPFGQVLLDLLFINVHPNHIMSLILQAFALETSFCHVNSVGSELTSYIGSFLLFPDFFVYRGYFGSLPLFPTRLRGS